MDVKPNKDIESKASKDAPLEKLGSSRLVQPQRSKTTMPAQKKHKNEKKSYFCCFGASKREVKPELSTLKE